MQGTKSLLLQSFENLIDKGKHTSEIPKGLSMTEDNLAVIPVSKQATVKNFLLQLSF